MLGKPGLTIRKLNVCWLLITSRWVTLTLTHIHCCNSRDLKEFISSKSQPPTLLLPCWHFVISGENFSSTDNIIMFDLAASCWGNVANPCLVIPGCQRIYSMLDHKLAHFINRNFSGTIIFTLTGLRSSTVRKAFRSKIKQAVRQQPFWNSCLLNSWCVCQIFLRVIRSDCCLDFSLFFENVYY